MVRTMEEKNIPDQNDAAARKMVEKCLNQETQTNYTAVVV